MNGRETIAKKGQKLFMFLLFLVLVSFPVLSIFNVEALFFGLPVLYVYLFTIWLLMVVLLYFTMKRKNKKTRPHE